jgi:hypothetical protein
MKWRAFGIVRMLECLPYLPLTGPQEEFHTKQFFLRKETPDDPPSPLE